MLIIVIITLVALGLVALTVVLREIKFLMPFATIVLSLYIILDILTGTLVPAEYGEWDLVNETELVELSNNTVYVSMSTKNVYTYRYKIPTEFGTETSTEYEVDNISGKVIESEDKNCKIPVLKEYKRNEKTTMWKIGHDSETKYVFYVPEGTIQKDVRLK